jgi:uncharacterized protein
LSKETITISAQDARRLAGTRQHLAGKLPAKATREQILSVVRDLTFVQWDPIEVVAPSHVLALWNRVGNFRLSDLDRLLWDEKKLFKHWANFAAALIDRRLPSLLFDDDPIPRVNRQVLGGAEAENEEVPW